MDRRVRVFLFDVQPTASSPHFGKIGGAEADIWVHHEDRDEAETMARAYVMDYGFLAGAVQEERVVREEEIQRYRADAQADFRRAIERGISGTFVASPPQDREDNTVEIHRMEPPHPSPGSKQ